MNESFVRVLAAKQKHLLRWKPVFRLYQSTTEAELSTVEQQLGCKLPSDLREWLLQAGFGDINDDLAFRREWFRRDSEGPFAGLVFFAQDILGNFYAFEPSSGSITFISRTAPECGVISPSFASFMEELERREFKLIAWVDSFNLRPYAAA